MKTRKDHTRKKFDRKRDASEAADAGVGAETTGQVEEVPDATSTSAEAQLAALNDRLLRLQADFDNYRKRMLREREAERLRANEDLMLELLPLLDHLEMGLTTADEHQIPDPVRQGFQMVYDQALGSLRKFGLEQIDASGQPFDPHHHESVIMAPSESTPREHVLTQIRRGYRLGPLLLRPAQVVVSSGPAEAEAPETGNLESTPREGVE